MSKKIVNVGDFVEVLDSSFVEHGVKKGDFIYIAGDSIVAVSEKDPYQLRRLFVAAFMEDGHILADRKPFLIDGKRCKPVSEAKQQKFAEKMKQDFGEKNETSD
ncbi:hypothetical protein [Pseudomonas phage PPAY]|uniref:Uncharacterized protein n=1 Tax=Variovorax paradoxus TaxID=34073 RepID=A0A2W5QL72_VARPD|nr:MAG: hypothetical protein DI563_01695 [Variovorax paradoxus]UCW44348.1 hypothetical protein [Pseudomonas phage PPAY]UCW44404.1 hypothetical protein [Pseudomonas phage PPAT]UVN13502.1 hypothetical protein FBPa8_0038 [Pseudomonas phage vB_PaeP_FBPa8]